MGTFECADCGRDDWTSLTAMMQCPCQSQQDRASSLERTHED